MTDLDAREPSDRPDSSDRPDLSDFPGSDPVPPSTDYVDQLEAQTKALMATQSHPGSDFDGAPAALREALEAEVEAIHDELVELMVNLYEHPEVAFEEVRSSRAIVEVLNKHGIEAELGAHGVETAIRAEIRGGARDSSGGADSGAVGDSDDADSEELMLAVLSEYDALPVVGHGCGHNVIAVMGLGAFLALAALAKKDPSAVPGRIVYLGTPAEEGHSGKEVMATGGAWKGIDAAVMAHPYGHDVSDTAWLGRRTLTIEYHGRTAHASAQPFMGRNALDAASLMYQGIGLLRQQIPPTDRVHAVIREGGDRASVIPDLARLDLYVRSLAPETLRDLSRRVEDVARGAALMTGCGVTVTWDKQPPSLPVRTNGTLTGRWVEAQRRRGRDPLPRGVVSETLAASTDFGNVSYRLPGIHPMIRIADPDTALHTREFAKAATSDLARSAAADGAYGLAASLLDMLHDAELTRAVKDEFEEAGGAIDVPSYFD
ncbi:M20 family metallopeptidase [Brachybacterium muris]|uniref:Peptidase M20 n=1 Tax=Brachybacterium muris UCD-AY4 TaxID=1249481 RepID=A0A022KVJ2_9MICO|nr:M20 family metallopeptidase [Brachybacterium muris]EYT48682.1 peptidase M20 [Brachybacterium muris UCD-AY4]